MNRWRSKEMGWGIGLAGLLLAAAGCGGSGPALVSVRGTVKIGGSQPFANGIVRFTPRAGKLSGGVAVTDADGKFVLKQQGQRQGVEAGDYNVSFSLWQLPDGSPLPSQDGVSEPKSAMELGGVDFVPVEYAKPDSSKNPVTVVKKGGSYDFDIPELKKPKLKR